MSKRLGRGLDALIPSLDVEEEDKVIEIPLSKLRANPYQPRKNFDDKSIDDLAQSIAEHGVIQPIIVRAVIKGFEIIAGERRWRASKQCNKQTIPAVVREFSDQQVMEIALIENLQREDLNAIEVAVAYQSLIDQFSLTQEELSLRVGKSRSHIANFLRLLQLPESIKEHVSRGTISMGHARAIVGIEDEKARLEMAKQTIAHHWSVRELEEAIKNMDKTKNIKKKAAASVKKDPYINEIEEHLRNRFRTTVKIVQQKNKGKIEIPYFSQEDLERLIDLLEQ